MNQNKIKPWITYKYKAIDWLESYLNADTIVFEWGSGSSTIYFTDKVKEIVSIEHDLSRYKNIFEIINDKNNIRYIYVEPKFRNYKVQYSINSYSSKDNSYKKCSFVEYAKIIEEYPKKYFDFVFINGRSRASCIKHAIKRVKTGGYIMLDNSERNHYNCNIDYMKNYESIDLYGASAHKNGIEDILGTIVWRIDNG